MPDHKASVKLQAGTRRFVRKINSYHEDWMYTEMYTGRGYYSFESKTYDFNVVLNMTYDLITQNTSVFCTFTHPVRL